MTLCIYPEITDWLIFYRAYCVQGDMSLKTKRTPLCIWLCTGLHVHTVAHAHTHTHHIATYMWCSLRAHGKSCLANRTSQQP